MNYTIQNGEVLKEQISVPECITKQNNLHLCGFDEQAEETRELTSFWGNWITKELCLEEAITPLITKAYRVGSKNSPTK